MLKPLWPFTLLLALSACAEPPTNVLEAQWQNLAAKVTLEPNVSHLRKNTVQIVGHITIKNLSAEPQQYSNRWLWIQTGTGARSRAYQASIASNVVDSGTIEIEPNGTFSFSAYWPFPESARDDLAPEALTLILGPQD